MHGFVPDTMYHDFVADFLEVFASRSYIGYNLFVYLLRINAFATTGSHRIRTLRETKVSQNIDEKE